MEVNVVTKCVIDASFFKKGLEMIRPFLEKKTKLELRIVHNQLYLTASNGIDNEEFFMRIIIPSKFELEEKFGKTHTAIINLQSNNNFDLIDKLSSFRDDVSVFFKLNSYVDGDYCNRMRAVTFTSSEKAVAFVVDHFNIGVTFSHEGFEVTEPIMGVYEPQ